MVETTTCRRCGAKGVPEGQVCNICGAAPGGGPPLEGGLGLGAVEPEGEAGVVPEEPVAPVPEGEAGVVPEEPGAPEPEVVPDDRPPAQEATRFRGALAPLVAAAVVLGIGVPLTALVVSQVGRLPATSGASGPTAPAGPLVPSPTTPTAAAGVGRAHLAGSVTLDGAVTPLGCSSGPPKLVLVGTGTEQYSILVTVPAEPGAYRLEPGSGRFVAVTRILGGAQSWTSRDRPAASGVVTVGRDQSLSARFSGLEPGSGGAEGTVEGTLEVRCG